VFNLIPSHNPRDTFRATTQGTSSNPTFKYHQNLVDHAHQKQTVTLPLHYRLALLLSRQAKYASRPPSGGHVPLGAKRLCCHYLQVSPGGTNLTARRHAFQVSSDFVTIAYRSYPTASHATPILTQY